MSARPKLVGIDGQGEATEYHDSVAIPSREDALLDELVDLRRKLAATKAENTKLRRVDPEADTVMERLERWQAKCHPKAKVPVEGKRWKITKARLSDGYTPEQLDAVIDIAADLPFEQYGRRFADDAPGRTRRDDLTFLFADETRVERLLELAACDNDARAYARFVKQACEELPEVRSALALLAAQAPHGSVLARAALWAKAGCPQRI
jgi:hypothetical protein